MEPNDTEKKSSPSSGWAKPVDKLHVHNAPAHAINLNVDGRSLTGPLRGFGQLWQKTYKVRLEGAPVSPQQVIAEWKANFPRFWPKGNDIYVPLAGIQPGEVGLINLTAPGGMRLSTGIMVIYTDDVSFSFMTPEGHMFAGMITFSADEAGGITEAQVQVLIRASDPLYEMGCRLGVVHSVEDKFWHGTLLNLAQHFQVNGQKVSQQNTLVDPRLQWKEAGNIWKNAGIRSGLYMPVYLFKRIFRR